MSRAAVRVAVAVCTRQRPRMLRALVSSFQTLQVPQGTELTFIFVENDTELTIGPLVADFAARTGWAAQAVHEPAPGLVMARNTALETATDLGADWLAFVDDDQQVRHDWLRFLYSGVRDANAQLGGGPVKPVPPNGGCSDSEGDVLAYYERAALLGDTRKEAAAKAGRRFDLATNNWIADLVALRGAGLRFDPAFNLSGGEDTDLSRRAHAAGLTLAWLPGAIATEEIPPERLTRQYIVNRARHQSITKLHLMQAERPGSANLSAIGQVISKGLVGGARIALSPILGRFVYYRGWRAIGIASGFWAGLRGHNQAHYSHVTGD